MIAGLRYVPDYLSKADERTLMQHVYSSPWLHDLQRRVQHYGYRYDYRRRTVSLDMKLGALPLWLQPLAEKLYRAGIFAAVPDQVIINEYMPGQGIAPHVDCEPCFGKTIVSISLGSPCVMEFSHPYTGQKHPLLLEQRSLLVLGGEARYQWRHGIPARKTDFLQGQSYPRRTRISLTFRTVLLS